MGVISATVYVSEQCNDLIIELVKLKIYKSKSAFANEAIRNFLVNELLLNELLDKSFTVIIDEENEKDRKIRKTTGYTLEEREENGCL